MFPASLFELALVSRSLNCLTTPYLYRKLHINFDSVHRATAKEKVERVLLSGVALANIREVSFSSEKRSSDDENYRQERAEALGFAISLVKMVHSLNIVR